MNEKTFKTDFISFKNRIKSDLIFGCIIVLGISIYWIFNGKRIEIIEAVLLMFFIVVGLLFIIEKYINSVNFISEIKISEEKIILIGYEFDEKWEEKLDLNKTVIKIKSKARGRGTIHYFLRLSCEKEDFDINKLFNWNYFKIVEIYTEFKKAKNEKIILDEKFILDNVLNKAKGLSPLDVLFNRTE